MDSPLSKVQLADIRRATARVADCRMRIERAKMAGLEFTEQEQRCDHLQKSLQQLLDVYTSANVTTAKTSGTTDG